MNVPFEQFSLGLRSAVVQAYKRQGQNRNPAKCKSRTNFEPEANQDTNLND